MVCIYNIYFQLVACPDPHVSLKTSKCHFNKSHNRPPGCEFDVNFLKDKYDMDKTQVLIKNVPKLTPNLENLFKVKYGAVAVKAFGRCRVVLRFIDERYANSALQIIHQSELCGRILSAEYLGTRKSSGVENEAPDSQPSITDFVRSLYATSIPHGFEQPPPPYLKYNYPAINRTILDSICIALLTNPKFYQQVLHLMNRMNLDPPFLPLKKPFVPPGEPCNAQTQTYFEQNTKNLLASDESELESDNESIKIKTNKKRKPPTDHFIIKRKVRKIIASQLHEKLLPSSGKREDNIQDIFENQTIRNFGKKIALNVATVKLPEKQQTDLQLVKTQASEDTKKITPLVGEELKLNRISENQWKDLTIFKNYQRGEKSNKLYVKNLSRDVTEEDLVNIYSRFVENADRSLSVKLMLYGKMKGQAFVTFNNLKDDQFGAVEKALDETNGYIWKNKPMVVSFAKS